jgi:hypothetical protein
MLAYKQNTNSNARGSHVKKLLVLSVVAPCILAGCAAQMAQDSLKERCAKEGKQVFLLDTSHTGIPVLIETASAYGLCVGPDDTVHLPDTFGADVVRGSAVKDGVGVFSVSPGSTADKAGLKASDIIYEFGGRAVSRSIDLRSAIEATPAGSQAIIKFRRNKREMTATAQF